MSAVYIIINIIMFLLVWFVLFFCRTTCWLNSSTRKLSTNSCSMCPTFQTPVNYLYAVASCTTCKASTSSGTGPETPSQQRLFKPGNWPPRTIWQLRVWVCLLVMLFRFSPKCCLLLVGLDVLPLYKLSFYAQERKRVISPRPVNFQ